MELFVGLDVSLRTTSVCVTDANGELIGESKFETEPDAIGAMLHTIGGPTSASALKPVRSQGHGATGRERRRMQAPHDGAGVSARLSP
ncbi:hypothetical protein [Mesorhizobium koreense]|jgi:hypothetical protein|uniref:hypothetical protein n=1 Tax=Mesorhizobium koreense TaxID=3074855 RepID=UPI00287B64ED|nr:hypothetical protein [Mesorhizobium sp. WR6]